MGTLNIFLFLVFVVIAATLFVKISASVLGL